MSKPRFSSGPVLERLKDFQRKSVDYVFKRLYLDEGNHRFLVADEVGLGKTLVAKGLIAKALEHLWDIEERIDVVYICSNAAIASQNVNRLNVNGDNGFAIASRLTFLPMQVQELAKNKINFISFTPGTTFDMRSRGGRKEERALIYKMLKGARWDVQKGFLNMLQGMVKTPESWRGWCEGWSPTIDRQLARQFRREVKANRALTRRLHECCKKFKRYRKHIPWHDSHDRYVLIGELRLLLAKTCLRALEPDLVILDEFQRFRDLLDGEDEAAELARALFKYPRVRVLLLSATPYKNLSLDHEQDDDHYPDFIRTLSFLYDNEGEVESVKQEISDYRRELFAIAEGDYSRIQQARDRLQHRLLQVMCRTERVGMTRKLDAMMEEPAKKAMPQPEDLDHAATADHAAQAVGAREPIEYWKSSPYLLNFLKHYDLRKKIDAVSKAPPDDLLAAFRKSGNGLLKHRTINQYQKVEAANARMRVLFEDTLGKGMWKLLWLPPSLPYSEPTGVYKDIGSVTKSLVFSAWNVVPDAIATLCTYEAERRMLAGSDKTLRHSELYDKIKPLLRFAKGKDDRLTGMPVIAWLLPSPTLANKIDPLEISLRLGKGKPISADALIHEAEMKCKVLLASLPKGQQGGRPDERWYWAALAMLDGKSELASWCADSDGWVAIDSDNEPGARFRDHIDLFLQAAEEELELGARPDDLPRVLAELAIAGPGVCALRALHRIAPSLEVDNPTILSAAARVADGFRTLFNIPETIGFLRGEGEDIYWRLVLRYALEGNIQALLDEQVHVLVESLGLVDHDQPERVTGVSESLAEALSIRTAQIKVDELTPRGQTIRRTDFNTRCRFALRFGELRDDREGTLARADTVREAFNSPFRPFILASTSIGQEGLDFHTWCHAVVHWNLPSNPVDLEQREGRVHRYKGHAVRKNIAEHYGLTALTEWHCKGDPWEHLFEKAVNDRSADASDIVPFWIYEEGAARIERRVPLMPYSKEVGQLDRLKRSLALYRLVYGQPRQEDLLLHLVDRMSPEAAEQAVTKWRISLAPPIED